MKLVENFDPKKIIDRLNIMKLDVNLAHLNKNQKKIIKLLIDCSRILHEVFCIQKYNDYFKLKEKIIKKNNTYLNYVYQIMCGPFNHFNNDQPYIEGIKKNIKAGYYPEDLTKSEWEKILKKSQDKIEDFVSPYTVIIRKNNQVQTISYSKYYKKYLKKAGDILLEASELTDNIKLKDFFIAQSNAFKNNDYVDSDIKWVQLEDNDIVPLLGPYECYEDKFLGYKASFSALVSIKNKEGFKKLGIIEKAMDLLQEKIPIPEQYRKQKRGKISQIEIVNVIFIGGDARCPIPTAAFNLPNSQKIRSEYGSKKVLLYNVMEAKFNSIMIPIAEKFLNENNKSKVSFNSYFNFILMHEISHELGIGFIKDDNGQMKDISYFLKDLYTIIEEAKADIMGIFSLMYLIKNGFINDSSFTDLCLTFLVNLIRSIRFGHENAHGASSLMQLNFFMEENVFIFDLDTGIFSIDFHKFDKTVEKFLTIILTLQGEGDYQKVKLFIKNNCKTSKIIKKITYKIEDLSLDIFPWFPKAGEKDPKLIFKKT